MKKTETEEFVRKRDFFLVKVNKDISLDFTRVFGNSKPLFLEIGSGKGEFLSEYSLLHPEWNFMGFEVRQKRVNLIIRKLNPELHKNVRIATFMIDKEIEKIIPHHAVEGVIIQHPDPWPKRKHFKRRLIQQSFLDALAVVVKPGGCLHISTDHQEYAEWIRKEMLQRKDFIPSQQEIFSERPLLDDHIETFYEKEQRKLGFEPIHMLFTKV